MVYNPNLANATSFYTSGQQANLSTKERIFARVVDIVLDESHQDYEEYGKLEAINGIRYKVLTSNQEETDPRNLPFAYCGESVLKRIPLIDEIVEIVNEPSNSLNENSYSTRDYYIKPLNLWNNAHHNALPDILRGKTEALLGTEVLERDDIATLQPFPGDLYIEGRLGQSLRFTGYKHPKNVFTDDENNGDPLTILRVGQSEEADIFKSYVEDINADQSSIYLTSNHSVNLNASTNKKDTYRDNTPDSLNTFRGNQIILDSGRILLHAKDDHLLLNSKNSIGLQGSTLNLDGIEYISVDSPNIYLGAQASEPILKGDTTVKLLEDILNAITGLVNTHSLSTPTTAHVQLIAATQGILPKLQSFKSRLQSLKSKKVFTE